MTQVAFHAPTVWGQWDRNWTFGQAVTPNVGCSVSAITFGAGLAATGTVTVSVWTTGGTRLGSGSLTTTFANGQYYTVNLSAPVSLTAGTKYVFSVYSSAGNGPYLASDRTGRPSHTHSGGGVTFTLDAGGYYSSGDVYPNANYDTGETTLWPTLGVSNAAPTVSNFTIPANFSTHETLTATWSYSDAEGNPQTQYEIGYRVSGSGSAFTTSTVAGTATSHVYAANTFLPGTSYEFQVRVHDGTSWSTYSTLTRSAFDPWTYRTEVSSATTSEAIPVWDVGGYDFQVRTNDGLAWGPWSTSTASFTVPATIAAPSAGGTASATAPSNAPSVTVPAAAASTSANATVPVFIAGHIIVTPTTGATASTPIPERPWTWYDEQGVSSATQQHVLGTAGWAPDSYEWQVRTSDGLAWGPWSTQTAAYTIPTTISAPTAGGTAGTTAPSNESSVTLLGPLGSVTSNATAPIFLTSHIIVVPTATATASSVTVDPIWTWIGEVTSGVQSGEFDTSIFDIPWGSQESYEWSVRTHDGLEWGGWSAPTNQVEVRAPLVRTSSDSAPASDAVTHYNSQHYTGTGADSAAASDSVSVQIIRTRTATDLPSGYRPRPGRGLVGPLVQPVFADAVPQGTTDQVTSSTVNGRSGSDAAPATDALEVTKSVVRAAREQVTQTKTALVFHGGGGGMNLVSRLTADGWNVTTSGTLPDLDTILDGGYSLLGIDYGYNGVVASALTRAYEAYQAGVSVLTTANDTTWTPGNPIWTGATTVAGGGGGELIPVVPQTGTGHPVAQGWSSFNDHDARIYLTGVRASAVVVGSFTYQGAPQTAVIAEQNPNGNGARYVHIQPYASVTPVGLTLSAANWLVEGRGKDAATRAGIPFIRTSGDTATAGDSATRYASRSRTASDSGAVFHGAVATSLHPRTPSDAAPAADDGTRLPATKARSASDIIPTVTDVAVRAAALKVRTGADTSLLTDAVASSVLHPRTATESLPLSDTATRRTTCPRTVGDTSPAADVAIGKALAFRTTPDVAPATDAATRRTTCPRTVGDAAPAVDDGTRHPAIKARAAAEVLSTSDAAVRSGVFRRTGADTAAAADAATRYSSRSRTAQDAVAASDTVASQATHPRTGGDTVPAATDSVLHQTLLRRSGSDASPVADVASRYASRTRTAGDSAVLGGDAATRSVQASRHVAEWLHVAPSAQRRTLVGPVIQPVFSEARPLDVIGHNVVLDRSVTDAAPATEAVASQPLLRRTSSDTSPATDAATRLFSGARAAGDAATAGDSATRYASRSRTTSDAALATDALSSVGLRSRTHFDVAAATDTVTRLATFPRTMGDSAPAVDDGTRLPAIKARSTSHTLSLSDVAVRSGVFRRTGADTAVAADAATRYSSRSRTTSDNAAANDSATRVLSLRRRADEWDLLKVGDRTAWSAGGTTVKGAQADPTGGYDAFSVNFNTGQVYALTTTYGLAAGLVPGVEYEFSALIRSADATNVTFDWSIEDFSASGDKSVITDGTPAYYRVTVGPEYTRFTRRFRAGNNPATKFLLYSLGGVAAGKVVVVYAPTLVQVVRVTDAVARLSLHPRTPSDTATATDSATRYASRSRTGADGAAATDTATRSGGWVRSASDQAQAEDSLAEFAARSRTGNDSAPGTDAATRYTQVAREIGEALYTADAVARVVFERRYVDDSAAGASDSATRLGVWGRTGADAAAASESVSRTTFHPRALGDSASGTDVALSLFTFGRAGYDRVYGLDVAVRVAGLGRSGLDLAAALDAAARAFTGSRTGEESVPTSESATPDILQVRVGAEAISVVTDALARLGIFGRTMGDSAPATDDGTRIAGVFHRDGAETISTGDLAGRAGSRFLRRGGDGASVADSARRMAMENRRGEDSAQASDVLKALGIRTRGVFDTAPALDTPVRGQWMHRRGGDGASVADAALRLYLALREAEDLTSTSDEADRIRIFLVFGQDTAPATDSPSGRVWLHREAGDGAWSADTADRFLFLYRHSTDQVQGDPLTWSSAVSVRMVSETLPTVTDGAVLTTWKVRLYPSASITSVSRSKVSHEQGFQSSLVEFVFDQPVSAWEVRVNSSNHLDGVLVERWTAPEEPVLAGQASVSSSALNLGGNEVSVYGRSLEGVWGR